MLIRPDLFVRQGDTENGSWDPEARSPSGAEGLFQLMPQYYAKVNRFNPEANMRAAAATVARYLKRYGTYAQAFAAYNGGPGAMDRWIAHYGAGWRQALREHPETWTAIAGYGGPSKAREVSLYLDRILGPDVEMSMDRPPSKWIGALHYSAGRRGQKVQAIVNHIAQGSLAGCDSWFNNHASGVSAHYCVGKNGEIHQYVRDEDTAYGNGVVKRPDLSIPWLADAVRQGINPNLLTISIEHEGFSGDEMPEEQYQASLALNRALLAENGLEANDHTLIGHHKINSVDKLNCPGTGFPWARLFADLAETAEPATDGGAEPTAPDVQEPEAAAEPPPPPDDLTLIFDLAGAIYNQYGAPEALEIHEAVNRIKTRNSS